MNPYKLNLMLGSAALLVAVAVLTPAKAEDGVSTTATEATEAHAADLQLFKRKVVRTRVPADVLVGRRATRPGALPAAVPAPRHFAFTMMLGVGF